MCLVLAAAAPAAGAVAAPLRRTAARHRRSSPAPARSGPSRQLSAQRRTQLRMPSSSQPLERVGNRALAHVRLARDRRIGRIEPAARVVQEVEDQRVQHLQGRMAHGSAVVVLAPGLPVEVAGAVP